MPQSSTQSPSLHSPSQPDTLLPSPISEGTRRRLLWTLFGAASIFNAAQITSFTLLSIVGISLTQNESLAGIPATSVLLGRAMIAYPIGWLMEKLGRRWGIGLGYFLSVIGTLINALAIGLGSFWLFCFGCLLNGMGRGTGEQSRYAGADIEPPARAASAISLIVWAGTVGSVIGPWLIAPTKALAVQWGLIDVSGPYLFTAVLSAISSLLIIALLYPDPKEVSQMWTAQEKRLSEEASGRPMQNRPGRSLGQIFRDPMVIFTVFSLACSQLVMTFIMIVNPLHMHHLHLSDQDISLATMMHTLGMFALSGLTSWLVGRLGKLPVILLGALVLISSAIVMPLSHTQWGLALGVFLLGYGWNLGYVAGSSLLSSLIAPNERGRTQGVSETLVAIAATAGSYSTGPSYGWGGITMVSLVGLSVALAQLLAVLWAQQQGEKRVEAVA